MASDKKFPIHLELTPGVVRALQTVARKHFIIPFPMKFTAESLVALHAVQFALTRPEELSKFIDSLHAYHDAEGLYPIDHGNQIVENNPAYRRKRLPETWLSFGDVKTNQSNQ